VGLTTNQYPAYTVKVWLARYFWDLLATLSLNILLEGMIVNNKVTTTAKPNWTIPRPEAIHL